MDGWMDGWMDGYFINPKGNLGHPVAYTHIHLYTAPTYIHKSHIHRENIFTQSVYRYRKGSDPIVQSAMILTVSVSRRKVKSDLVLLVWIVQKKYNVLVLVRMGRVG